MLDKIDNILESQCLLHPPAPLLVGVSGGPDSLCLLHVLHQLGYPLTAMHVNHCLRPEAESEVEVVRQNAERLGIEFVSVATEVMDYAAEHSISIEEAGRTLRYLLFFKQAKERGLKAVVVGHNADDQVETIMMHILRGSGLSGLRGMGYRTLPNPWDDAIPLCRPLLSTWRTEIQAYLDEHDLLPVLDQSNQDVTYYRNRIRHELLPILKNYNPAFQETLLRMGQSVRDDYNVIENNTDRAWDSILLGQGNGYLQFHTPGFIELPVSIQRHLLRRAILQHIPGLIDVGFDCIERGRVLVADPDSPHQADLVAGLRLFKEGEHFWVASWQADLPVGDFPAVPGKKSLQLFVPSQLSLMDSWVLQAEILPPSALVNIQDESRLDPFQAWLDADSLEFPLSVRTRKPGDRIAPLGLAGHSVKISDVMINQKVPKRARPTWPLVCSGAEIVWLPGFRPSHKAALTPGSTNALHLRLSRPAST